MDILPVYKRCPIQYKTDAVVPYLTDIHAIVVFSGEGLQHLTALCPVSLHEQLFRTQLVVPGMRVVKMAQDMGFKSRLWPVRRMTEEEIIATLKEALGDVEPGNHVAG